MRSYFTGRTHQQTLHLKVGHSMPEKTINDSRKEITEALDKLSALLDSDAYMEMVADIDTPPDVRKQLNAQWSARNKLVRALLDVYAMQIKANNARFKEFVSAMGEVNKAAEAAADGLKKISDRIQDAVALAKAVDNAIQAAVSVAV